MTATSRPSQLSSVQVCAVFGISNMTLWNWRKGTKTMAPLPEAKPRSGTQKPLLRFNVASVLAWAKKHNVIIAKTPEQVLAGKAEVAAASKPGPKPRSSKAP